jgi:crossover junction endodeoxyribonuclease RuvC
MRVLGIDPSTRSMGYSILKVADNRVILQEAGVLKFQTKDLKGQIEELDRGMDEIIRGRNITSVAIEDIFFAYNPKTVIKLAQFRGALLLKIVQTLGDYSEYTPLEVKQSITGNGKSTKEQVAFMVKRILNIRGEIKPLDITDAMAVAITHIQRIG